jgi:bifunctional DNA-binding transcriptional regulator/antitoxin component of YhaV-PrlF toxin-antitoxin module
MRGKMQQTTCRIDEVGRVLLPAKVRKELGVEPGMDLLLTCSDGVVRLETRAQALARARRLARRLAPEGTSVVDEFLAERRQEARREAKGRRRARG